MKNITDIVIWFNIINIPTYIRRLVGDDIRKKIHVDSKFFDASVLDSNEATSSTEVENVENSQSQNPTETHIDKDLLVDVFGKKNEDTSKRFSKEEWNKQYYEYMNSREWAELSQKRFLKDGLRCQLCGSPKNLVAHHLTYCRVRHEEKLHNKENDNEKTL